LTLRGISPTGYNNPMAMQPSSNTPLRATWRLPNRLAPVAFSFYMAGIVAFLMSLTLTAINTGIDGGYPLRVLKAYALALPVGFLGVMAARPLVLRLVACTVAPASSQIRKE
jgi:hypothetical protein